MPFQSEARAPRACCFDPNDDLARFPPSWPDPCGVALPSYGDESVCTALVPGERDESCLDAVYAGRVIQGCRRADGRCGHQAGAYGCVEVLRTYWAHDVDTADVANPFVCVRLDAPCRNNFECCEATHGSACDFGPDGPNDEDNDAGSALGVCVDSEDLVGR